MAAARMPLQQDSKAPLALDETAVSDRQPMRDSRHDEAGEESDEPGTQLAGPHDGEDTATCGGVLAAQEREKNPAVDGDPVQQDATAGGDHLLPVQHTADDDRQQSETTAALDPMEKRVLRKRSASTEFESVGLVRGFVAPRKKRLAFAVASASMQSPGSSGESVASEDEYDAASYEDHDDDEDDGIPLDLAQKEASLELAELSDSGVNPVPNQPIMVPDGSETGTTPASVSRTGSGAVVVMMVPDGPESCTPPTSVIPNESECRNGLDSEVNPLHDPPTTVPDGSGPGTTPASVSCNGSGTDVVKMVPDPVDLDVRVDISGCGDSCDGEDAAVAALEASRGCVVEAEGAFVEGFDRRFNDWNAFFAALTTHSEATFQMMSKRTSYSAVLRNKKMQERGIVETDPRLLPATFPYYSLTMMCTHGIKHPRKGKRKRQRKIIRFLDCEAKVKVLSKRDVKGVWKVCGVVGRRCSRGPNDKEEIIGALQLMMKAKSAQAYKMYRQDMLRSLGHNMKDPFYEYFDANWETCKEEWVDYLRDNVPHLNNHTNNRIESGWGKIKQVVDREDPIDELISTLVMLQEWSEERYMKEFKCLGTRQPPDVADAADPELVTLAVQLSHHAYRLVRGQYQYACSADAAYEISINGATAMLLTKRGSSDHSVHEVNTKTFQCNCTFMRTLLLPCRHVIYFRKHQSCESDIPPPKFYTARWSLLSPTNDISTGHLDVERSLRTVKRNTKTEGVPSRDLKYSNARAVCQQIQSIMAEQSTDDFKSTFALLQTVEKLCRTGEVRKLADAMAVIESQAPESEPKKPRHHMQRVQA
ncbi:hypothetical protein PF010_g28174, partial [Phytophthora fragariae]